MWINLKWIGIVAVDDDDSAERCQLHGKNSVLLYLKTGIFPYNRRELNESV